MFEKRSLKWPITLAVLMIVLLVVLLVGWILLNVFGALASSKSAPVYWILLSIGSASFICVVVGVVMYLTITIKQVNLTRRQSNFIDAVTHELKSPIASLKLYLQTLNLRAIDEEQRQEFYGSMLEDVERLDRLINHLLDVARLELKEENPLNTESVRCDALVEQIALEVCKRYRLDPQVLHTQVTPIEIQALPSELDILCRNLIDNAVKYAGNPPRVEIELKMANREGWLELTVRDNGPGIPRKLRRQVFGRFFRIGDELVRTKPGTGIGLFLARTIVKKLNGKIQILDPSTGTGTVFVLQLPSARALETTQQRSDTPCKS